MKGCVTLIHQLQLNSKFSHLLSSSNARPGLIDAITKINGITEYSPQLKTSLNDPDEFYAYMMYVFKSKDESPYYRQIVQAFNELSVVFDNYLKYPEKVQVNDYFRDYLICLYKSNGGQI